MREFIDLHLIPKDLMRPEDMLLRAKSMGYSAVGFPISEGEHTKVDVDTVSRVDLKPNSKGNMLKILRKIRRNVEIIAVQCGSKGVARQAAKDHRVDVLNFLPDHRRRYIWFDRQEANLAKDTNCSYEINLRDLFYRSQSRVAELLRRIKTEISIATKYGVPVILSSGATNAYELRDPRTLASTLELLDIDQETALDMISVTPRNIVERNRRKLEEDFIHPGVWRVKDAS